MDKLQLILLIPTVLVPRDLNNEVSPVLINQNTAIPSVEAPQLYLLEQQTPPPEPQQVLLIQQQPPPPPEPQQVLILQSPPIAQPLVEPVVQPVVEQPVVTKVRPITINEIDEVTYNRLKKIIINEYLSTQKVTVKPDETCPEIPEAANFDLSQQLGDWYIIETSLDLPECAFAVRKDSFRYYGYSSVRRSNYNSLELPEPVNITHYVGQPKEQTLTVNYIDRATNAMKTRYSGRTSRTSGGSYTNTFTTGSKSNVTIVAADYSPSDGYVLMVTCTRQANGDFSVNSNILSRSPSMSDSTLNALHSTLGQYGMTDVMSRLKRNNQKNCYLLGELSKYKSDAEQRSRAN